MSKIGSFFKNFGKNFVADPMSTLVGLGKLAAAGATCYGMATGAVPINQLSIGTAASLAAAGVRNLGTGPNGQEAPAAVKAETALNSVQTLAPVALSAVDTYKQIATEAVAAKQKLDQFAAVSAAIQTALQTSPQLSAPAPVPEAPKEG